MGTLQPQDDIERFRLELRDWLSRQLPAPPSFALPQSFLEVESEQQFAYLRDWQRKLYEAGYLGFDVPEAYGGRGIDPAKHAIVAGELARARAPFLVNTIGLRWVAPTILKFGTEQQKQRLVGPILSTEHIWCQGFSEPEAGSDLASLRTRAERDGDAYVVTGHKLWTTIAHFAQYMILLARSEPDANKHAGISYFLFPMGGAGVTVEPLRKMSGEGGFNQVVFDHAPMPTEALLGREGQGWEVAMATLTFERGAVGGAGQATAATAEEFRRLVALAKRHQSGGRAAASDPLLRDKLARLWIAVEAARWGEQRARPQALPMMSKLVRSELDQRIAELGCELLGQDANLWVDDPDAPDQGEWPRAYMNSFGFTIGGGTSEILRSLLAERVLGLPRSR